MKIKTGDTLAYRDDQTSALYGIGVVMEITDAEYTILWAGKGSRKYKRSILDHKLGEVFQRRTAVADLPVERRLQLNSTGNAIAFNENYDREKVKRLCDDLKSSSSGKAKTVADGLDGVLFTRKLALRAATKTVFNSLAELCGTSDAARQISRELFFGYVIQESDFAQP